MLSVKYGAAVGTLAAEMIDYFGVFIIMTIVKKRKKLRK